MEPSEPQILDTYFEEDKDSDGPSRPQEQAPKFDPEKFRMDMLRL